MRRSGVPGRAASAKLQIRVIDIEYKPQRPIPVKSPPPRIGRGAYYGNSIYRKAQSDVSGPHLTSHCGPFGERSAASKSAVFEFVDLLMEIAARRLECKILSEILTIGYRSLIWISGELLDREVNFQGDFDCGWPARRSNRVNDKWILQFSNSLSSL